MTDHCLSSHIAALRTGAGAPLPSVCSAHGDVLEASLRLARDLDRPLIVEATSNQVNQHGGYTGMTPEDFVRYLDGIADRVGMPRDSLILGGDHLGPQAWRSLPAEEAMAEAETMLRDYVRAGFSKIHLDCSEGCAGEPAQLPDAVTAARAARLAKTCEAEATSPLAYIVGTEVPVPGGARGDDETVRPTSADAARATLKAHQDAMPKAAWAQVCGLVVQPGLEFAPAHIDRFDTAQPDPLASVLADYPRLSLEAHSTDYQTGDVYADLGRRGFAILKVGPALTFAWREALYALSHIDGWLTGADHISTVTEAVMVAEPGYWQGHYAGEDARLRLLRHFSYADRIRYYWLQPRIAGAVTALQARIDAADPMAPLAEQYLPRATLDRAEALCGEGIPPARAILMAHVQEALRPYFVEAPCC